MAEENNDQTKALTTLQDAAALVETYATRMRDRDTAHQFGTHISIMAQRDPKFKSADPASVVTAMMACVELNLMPNTPQQLAHLIPYKVGSSGKYNIQFQLGYKGLLELADRTGKIKAIYAELVYEGDEFSVELGTERRIKHIPGDDIDKTDYSKVTHAYMVAILTNGERMFEYMTRKQLDKIQESSKAKSTDSPWQTWPEEMARKTVVKRGVKLLPSSGDDNRLQFASALDSWSQAGKLRLDDGRIVEGEVIEEDEKAARRQRIESAEKAKKKLDDKNHTPKAVEKAKTEEPANDRKG